MDSVTQGTQEVREQAPAAESAEAAREMAGVSQVDPAKIEGYLDQKVRESVEQTLNTLSEPKNAKAGYSSC
jgi:hypothetical protein